LAALGFWCGHTLAAIPLDAQEAPPPPAADSSFLLTSGDPARAPSPFIGNGRLGVVVPPLGIGATPSIAAGLYEHGPGDVPRIVAVPAWNAVAVAEGDRWLEPDRDSIASYRQTIDMATATASTQYEWIAGTRRTTVRLETLISRAGPRLAAQRLQLTAAQAGRMRVRFALAGWPAPPRLPLDTLTRTERSWGPKELWYPGHMVVRTRAATAATRSARLSLTASPEGRSVVFGEAAEVHWPADLAGAQATTRAAGDSALVEITFDAIAGQNYTFTQLTGFASTAEPARPARPLDLARRRVQTGAATGYDGVASANARAWAKRWETDISVDGDPELQRVSRAMLFYLLCSADSGTAMGIPPMGLSSGGYYGHVFWDSDTWMFPSLLMTHPDVAHSMVAFRARTLPAAQANARAHGFRGAMYPWEADERGVETTPHFAAQNASSEIHVNGDVAYAQWQYYLATGDSVWLAREGFPVLRSVADFWVSRASFDSAGGQYHVRNVVSVAEGLVGVSDDAYTNAVARRSLEFATAAATRLGAPADPRWQDVAARLHMPIDSATGSWRTYEGAPDSTLGLVTPLLAFPLGVPIGNAAKRAHLDQVVRRLADEAQGAMMGITLLSVGAAELGDRRLVDSLLPYSYRNHLKGPFLVPSETPTNKAFAFLTGAGGFLQQVIFGYTGLRLSDKGVEPRFAPVLPSHVRRLRIRDLHVRGGTYDVTVDSTGLHMVSTGRARARAAVTVPARRP
jgi:trehalose/maltose hydrolase-like predicted phosphorylase